LVVDEARRECEQSQRHAGAEPTERAPAVGFE
jgi:hypothetical protein